MGEHVDSWKVARNVDTVVGVYMMNGLCVRQHRYVRSKVFECMARGRGEWINFSEAI